MCDEKRRAPQKNVCSEMVCVCGERERERERERDWLGSPWASVTPLDVRLTYYPAVS